MTAAAPLEIATLASTAPAVPETSEECLQQIGSDFTAAMAAAVAPPLVVTEVKPLEVALPEGAESAALAWMAGLLGEGVPRTSDAGDSSSATESLQVMPDAYTAQSLQGSPKVEDAVVASMPAMAGKAVAAVESFATSTPALPAVPKAPTSELPNVGRTRPVAAKTDLSQAAPYVPQLGALPIVTRLAVAMAEPATNRAALSTSLDTPAAPSFAPSVPTYEAAVIAEPAAAATLRASVGTPRWADELGSRLVMMAVRGQHEGSLTLTPEHLGPVEVRISVSQDVTSVWFGAQSAETRAALTDAMPRLRELFAASGLALGHAGVSHDMPRQEARQADAQAARTARGGNDSPDSASAPIVRRVHAALLDTWA